MMKVPTVAALLSACMLTVAAPAHADPSPGGMLPSVRAVDLAGHVHQTRELRQSTVVIVVTSPEARAASEQWVAAAEGHAQGTPTRVVVIVALSLPFFVPDAMVQSRAQPATPRRRWADTWIDAHGDAQRAFGVRDGSPVPWAFTVDASGHVVASVHVPVGQAQAQRVWASL